MKVLFGAVHFAAFRNFEHVIGALAAGGHEVLLLADEPDDIGGDRLIEALTARHPGAIRAAYAPDYVEHEPWFLTARKLRMGLDYLRFCDPQYAAFPKLRTRASERVPRLVRWITQLPGGAGRWRRDAMTWAIGAIDRGMPRSTVMTALLEQERPDAVVLASVTNPRTPQLDHLRCALALGIPAGVAVYSWDHLSSKALIREAPHRTFVWNEAQRQEAVDLHGLSPDQIVVTGAQCYDHWFGREPSRTRAAFCAGLGLSADRPIILYVCSALTPDPRESSYVREWLKAVRSSEDPRLRDASVIIRPHPERRDEWAAIDWPDSGPMVIAGQNPLTDQAKNDYFDAMFHSAAVVGLVTSAFLEAAVVGRPVLTFLHPDLRDHQEGMLHFRYLLEYKGGLLTASPSIAAHVTELERAIHPGWPGLERQARFIRAFLRPHGLDTPASPRFVDEILALGRLRVQPFTYQPSPVAVRVARRLVAAKDGLVAAALRSAREEDEFQKRQARLDVDRRQKAERRELKKERLQELERYRDAKRANAAARKADKVRQRLAANGKNSVR